MAKAKIAPLGALVSWVRTRAPEENREALLVSLRTEAGQLHVTSLRAAELGDEADTTSSSREARPGVCVAVLVSGEVMSVATTGTSHASGTRREAASNLLIEAALSDETVERFFYCTADSPDGSGGFTIRETSPDEDRKDGFGSISFAGAESVSLLGDLSVPLLETLVLGLTGETA